MRDRPARLPAQCGRNGEIGAAGGGFSVGRLRRPQPITAKLLSTPTEPAWFRLPGGRVDVGHRVGAASRLSTWTSLTCLEFSRPFAASSVHGPRCGSQQRAAGTRRQRMRSQCCGSNGSVGERCETERLVRIDPLSPHVRAELADRPEDDRPACESGAASAVGTANRERSARGPQSVPSRCSRSRHSRCRPRPSRTAEAGRWPGRRPSADRVDRPPG